MKDSKRDHTVGNYPRFFGLNGNIIGAQTPEKYKQKTYAAQQPRNRTSIGKFQRLEILFCGPYMRDPITLGPHFVALILGNSHIYPSHAPKVCSMWSLWPLSGRPSVSAQPLRSGCYFEHPFASGFPTCFGSPITSFYRWGWKACYDHNSVSHNTCHFK